MSYFTNLQGTITLNNPGTVSIPNTYYIKATSTANCTDFKPVVVVVSNCEGSVTLVSPADDVTMGASTRISSGIITATNKASNSPYYTLDAKNAVQLNPGFTASGSGVVFLAKIGGCTN